MLNRLFPKRFDNDYRGPRLAIWLLATIAAIKALQGINSIVMTEKVMTSADAIPLQTFNPAAQHEATTMFALLGMYLLVLPVLSFVALIRYRSMIPLLYLMLITVQLGAKLLNYVHGTLNNASLGSMINYGILAATLAGFVLSLMAKPAEISRGDAK